MTGVEEATAWAHYLARFAFLLAASALLGALRKMGVYRIHLHWLRWIDNAAGLGHHAEWRLEEGRWRVVESKLRAP